MDAHIARGLKLGLPMASHLHSGQPTSLIHTDAQRLNKTKEILDANKRFCRYTGLKKKYQFLLLFDTEDQSAYDQCISLYNITDKSVMEHQSSFKAA